MMPIETDFHVYDGRAHVLGASMLAAMDRALRGATGAAAETALIVKRAKFTRKTGDNGTIAVSIDGTDALPSDLRKTSAAALSGQVDGRKVEAWFLPDPGHPTPPMHESEHVISHIAPEGEHGGCCHLRATGLEHALKGLVDCNKLVQLQGGAVRRCFGETKPITELVYAEAWTLDDGLQEIDSDIVVTPMSLRENDGRLYTLTTVSYTDAKNRARSLRFGFSFAPPGAALD